ncbi:disintegrin and metalloproteinase domain-containing protein 33 isoform X2 [Trichogramma pretiosum]|uniref:disintegrin and metalloproteinase domain-containing protein 33 isoform X2 n=1 Tax=Trichogramma pretiosum TaxID=7493 RepID=UPI0006C94AFE|nr:disintegrin and metalloproteinase domain-containing protein 33 isoform X2 [Trichogramma pretiosum]
MMPRVAYVLFILLLLDAALASSFRRQGPSSEFSEYSIVRPRVYHARSKREISSTKESDDNQHTELLSVGIEIDGISRILDLKLNRDLIPVGYKERYQHEGRTKTHAPVKTELCHYQGSIRDIPDSWVAVSTCNGLKGVIFDGKMMHHIQPEQESLQAAHYLYKHSHLLANGTCGYEGTPHHISQKLTSPPETRTERISRHKRAAESIRGPYNANRHSRYIELVLVIDYDGYWSLNKNRTRVDQHCKDIANIINALYAPLNIFVALVGIEVWTDVNKIAVVNNGDQTLKNFLQYRKDVLVREIPNDNAQLLVKMHFDEGVIGKALKGPICTNEFSGGVSVDHSRVVGIVAATVAHEMGHNFGMEHDTTECNCPEDRCIMASSTGPMAPTHWSSCSLEYLALAFEHGMDYCLRNKPTRLLEAPICGNGFVEPGEQCDCGLEENCDNPCCDPLTCMLHYNASCATGQCCDLKTCRPKKAGTECRSADQECDLPEYCTGESEYCPKDVFKIDGEVCNSGKAFCYQGSCRTHNDQCKLLWGPTGSSSDELCYFLNNKGSKNGNCGFNRTLNDYIKCEDEHSLCGMLHCKHLNERLEFGMENVAVLSHSFINSQGKIIPCRSAIVDLGLNQVDPGLAPDGAKCGPKKMCVNQKCRSAADLKQSLFDGKACPNNCSGNGICNSLGHCHCNRGYQPPDCTQPGVGGSLDSGPAEDPNARSEYIMSLYIIFLGIVPAIAIISFGVWYARNNGASMKQWKKANGPMSTLTRNFHFDHPPRHTPSNRHITSNGGNCLSSIKTIDPLPRVDVIDSTSINGQQDPACASLLPKTDPDERFNNNFFGQFKGYSISPLMATANAATNSQSEIARPAPTSPSVGWNIGATTVPIKTNFKPIQRNSTLGRSLIPASEQSEEEQVAPKPVAPPALPPPNAGSTARPLISCPVLATTTCTSVEFTAPKVPTRPAPEVPYGKTIPIAEKTQPSTTTIPLESPTESVASEKKRGAAEKNGPSTSSTLTRIASMLYPMTGVSKTNESSVQPRYHTHSLPRSHHHKANKVLDREVLRNLEISSPILQKEIEIPGAAVAIKPVSPEDGPKRNIPMRAQSMRSSKITPRSGIQSFGSMRYPPGAERPVSILAKARPTSPPPVPPIKSPSSDSGSPSKKAQIYETPSRESRKVPPATDIIGATYDDCMDIAQGDANLVKIIEESPSNDDNIYAVIEEASAEKPSSKKS